MQEELQLQQKAYTQMAKREWQGAMHTLLQRLESDPEDKDTLIHMATCLDNTNDFNALHDLTTRLIRQYPQESDILALHARALQKKSCISEATIANDQALLLDSHLGLAWINRSGLQLLTGKFPEALRSSQRAIELAPNDPRAWFNRGMALLNVKRLGEALEAFDHSLAIEPTQLLATLMKCEIYSQIGRIQDMLPLIKSALAVDPDNQTLLIKGIEAVRTLEMYEELCTLSQCLIKQEENNVFAWEHYVRGLRGLGHFEDANLALDRLLELEPSDVRFWTFKADTLFRIERYREAVSAAEYARRINADYPPAQRVYEKSLRLMYQRKDRWKQREKFKPSIE
jgi:tetratricopeptide (TPR) repeat protein